MATEKFGQVLGAKFSQQYVFGNGKLFCNMVAPFVQRNLDTHYSEHQD